MSKNTKSTSAEVSSLAGATLNDPNASDIAKSFAASALSQAGTGRQTGAEMEDKAAKALASSKYSDDTKTLAASVLAQANRER